MISKSENHKKGCAAEDAAALFLTEKGYRILERNYRFHRNEIDIIAKDGDYLCFIEVKARSAVKQGYGYQAVNGEKQRRIRKVAEFYLISHQLYNADIPCRFDVISIDCGIMTLMQNAF